MRAVIPVLAISALLVMLAVVVASAQDTQACDPIEQSTEEVLPGIVLTWDSAFLCADAPDEGSYEFTVTVANSADSAEAISIDDLALTHTTPRPRGQAPGANGEATGLPLPLVPGETASFTVSGTYELVQTDEGKKANLHFRASGHGVSSSEPFELGINAHVRAPGVPLD
ncbi:hypothetical protein HRbin26_00629 [bacterium HR26]|nr:hypothetical protein HRbin26_00629 [bacterium HR26]